MSVEITHIVITNFQPLLLISSKDLSLLKLHPFLNRKKLVIADGHHRYESALAYGKEMGFTGGTRYVMAVLVNRYDFISMKEDYDARKQIPATPAIPLFYSLDYQLERMLQEGRENRFRRHKEMAAMVQEWGRENFSLFAEPGYESVTLTVVNNTRNLNVIVFFACIMDEFYKIFAEILLRSQNPM